MGNHAEERRPVHDEAVPLPRPGLKAGGEQGKLASRKSEILHTGSIGHVPGHSGKGNRKGSSSRAGYVEEAPRQAQGPMQFGVARPAERPRPMPRDVPMEEEYTRAGRRVRFLDGSNKLMRDRPGMVAEMKHPDTHPDDKADLRQHIAERDAFHGHVYW